MVPGSGEKQAALWRRDDGETLIYSGRTSAIFGLPGSGKSWLGLMVAKATIEQGARVVLWDFEEGPETLYERSQLLGAQELIGDGEKLQFARPDLIESPNAIAEAIAWLGPLGLMILDGVERAGCPSDGGAIGPWFDQYVEPWRAGKVGVLLLDHVAKRPEGRPRGAIGSQAKLARLDGVGLLADGTCWTKRGGGKVRLFNHKDRPGDFPAPIGQCGAVVIGNYADVDGQRAFGVTVEASDGATQGDDHDDLDDLGNRILEALETHGRASSANALVKLVKARKQKVLLAAERLAFEGLITKEPEEKGWAYGITEPGRAALLGDD